MKVLVGYPSDEEEFVIVQRVTGALQEVPRSPPPSSWPRCSASVVRARRSNLMQYAVRLVSATRQPARFGLADIQKYILRREPRATIHLIEGALAHSRGAPTCCPRTCDLVPDVLRHRPCSPTKRWPKG